MNIDKNKTYIVDGYRYINYINLTLEQKMAILEARNMPIVREKMYSSAPIMQDDHLAFIEGLSTRMDSFYWYVEKDGIFVGAFNLTNVNIENGTCESGSFFTDVSLRGMRTNMEFSYSTIVFMFEHIGIKKVVGFTKESNTFNLQLNKYLGFKPTNTFEGYVEQVYTYDMYTKLDKTEITFNNFIKSLRK